MHFHQLPESVPGGEIIMLVLDALRNRAVDYQEAAHATWHCVGYGLHRWQLSSGVKAKRKPLTKAQAIVLLEKTSRTDRKTTAKFVIPWELLLPVLIELLLKLFKK